MAALCPRLTIRRDGFLARLQMLEYCMALSLGREVMVWGRDVGPGPYRLLHLVVPGFQYIRIPERLGLLAMLFVALLVGQGLTVLRAKGLAVAAAALAVIVPLEHVSPLPLTERIPVWGDVPAVYRWLRSDSARAVAEVPVHGEGLIRKETLEEYFSTYHFKPIVHGYVSYPPLLSVNRCISRSGLLIAATTRPAWAAVKRNHSYCGP